MLSPIPATLTAPEEQLTQPDGITVLGVQFASIKSLFAPLREHAELMFVHVNDWLNVVRCKLDPGAFVQMESLAGVEWREWRYPPGWTNRLAPWVMPRVAERVEWAWRKRGWRNPRLVVTFPYFLPAVRALGPERAIYYAVDNYQAYWPDRAAALREQENELIRKTAASIAASSALADWFRERVPEAAARIHYLPNGIRPEMICSPRLVEELHSTQNSSLAQGFVAGGGPIVGYYGHIGSQSGMELLVAIAARLPDFRFLMMGKVLSHGVVARLGKFPNVAMTGYLQEPDSLQFLRQCDVMIIPMPVEGHGRFASPNRLWTYLATGKPIVSTPIPEVVKFGELVYTAANVDEFVIALRRVARESDPERVARRLEVAKQHTWPVLAQRLWSIIASAG
jgi:glycosyltransferase involved in cell wall biosynthesis